MARRAAVPIVAALAALSVAPRASAFCRTTTDESFVQTSAQPCDPVGTPLAWSGASVDYWLNQDASVQINYDDARQSVSQAFINWISAGCPAQIATCAGSSTDHPSIAVAFQGPTHVHAAEYKGDGHDQNVVLFWDSGWPHADPQSTLALTTVTFDKGSGEIYDVDIEVNSDPSINTFTVGTPTGSQFDLASIFQHETGHFFGLAHTQPDNTGSTMVARYKPGSTSMRVISPDDVCGICTIYPPGRSTYQTEKAGCKCAIVGGDVDGANVAIAGGVVVAMAGALRRRRR